MDIDSLVEIPTLVLGFHVFFGLLWLGYAVMLGVANNSIVPVVLNGFVALGIVAIGVVLRRRVIRQSEGTY
jgi:hypothetical protein